MISKSHASSIMISDQNCSTQISITTLLDPFRNYTIFLIAQYRILVSTNIFMIQLGTKVANLPHSGFLCLSFSWNLIGYLKQTLKSNWLFCFSVLISLAGEMMRFRAKNGAIRE